MSSVTVNHSTPGPVSTPGPMTISTEITDNRDIRKVAGRLLTLIDACFRGEPEQLKAIKDLVRQELTGPIYFPPTEMVAGELASYSPRVHGGCEDPLGDRVVFYGPQQCGECGKMIVMSGWEFGSVRYDQPEGTVYPNTEWNLHRCDRSKRS